MRVGNLPHQRAIRDFFQDEQYGRPRASLGGINFEVYDDFNDVEDGYYMPLAATPHQQMKEMAIDHRKLGVETPRMYVHKDRAVRTLLAKAARGEYMAKSEFMEAMSYPDMNYIFSDIISRSVMKDYKQLESPLASLYHKKTVKTMGRPHRIYGLWGMTLPVGLVNPGEQGLERYPQDTMAEVTVYKYMGGHSILWETLREDDLGLLAKLPTLFGRALYNTEAVLNTLLYLRKGGFNSTFSSSEYGEKGPFNLTANDKIRDPELNNQIVVKNRLEAHERIGTPQNALLNVRSLQAAQTQMATMLGPERLPIQIDAQYLIVGLGQQMIAYNLFDTPVTRIVSEGGGGMPNASADNDNTDANEGFVRIGVSPKTFEGLKVVVDPFMHYVMSNQEDAAKAWMLMGANGDDHPPNFVIAKLEGWEGPVVERRIPQYTRIGGMSLGRAVDWISTNFRFGLIHGNQWVDSRTLLISDGKRSANTYVGSDAADRMNTSL